MSSVRVVDSSSDPSPVSGGVPVSVIGPSTVTSVLLSLVDTVKILLLSEVPQSSSLDFVVSLQTTNSSETPAGSAASLVLDGSDSSFVHPEFSVGNREISEFRNVIVGEVVGHVYSSPLSLLVLRHGGEEVEGVLGGVFGILVRGSYQMSVLFEQSEPHCVFTGGKLHVLLSLEVSVQLESSFRGPEQG